MVVVATPGVALTTAPRAAVAPTPAAVALVTTNQADAQDPTMVDGGEKWGLALAAPDPGAIDPTTTATGAPTTVIAPGTKSAATWVAPMAKSAPFLLPTMVRTPLWLSLLMKSVSLHTCHTSQIFQDRFRLFPILPSYHSCSWSMSCL